MATLVEKDGTYSCSECESEDFTWVQYTRVNNAVTEIDQDWISIGDFEIEFESTLPGTLQCGGCGQEVDYGTRTVG